MRHPDSLNALHEEIAMIGNSGSSRKNVKKHVPENSKALFEDI